jgi:hypothetical protein
MFPHEVRDVDPRDMFRASYGTFITRLFMIWLDLPTLSIDAPTLHQAGQDRL